MADNGWGCSKDGGGGGWGEAPAKEEQKATDLGSVMPAEAGGWGDNSKAPDGGGWDNAAPQGDGNNWGAPSKAPDEDEGGWGTAAPQGDADDWGALPKASGKDGGGWEKGAPQGDGDDWGAPAKRPAEDWAGRKDGPGAKRPRNNEEGELDRLPDYLELACPDDFVTKQIGIPPGAAGAIIGKGGANIKALRASIPGFVQIKLEKGVNLVEVTSDSVAAVEKVESYIEGVVARIHSKNFRPDVSISCFQVPDGACRLFLQLLPRDARARCLPEFLSATKEVYFYHSCMPDCPAEEGGESPTSPLPPQPAGKDSKPAGANGQEISRASGRVVCLDWLGGQAEKLLPEFADILRAAASTYKRGTRLKVQAQIAKNFFRGAEENVSISASAKELEDMLAIGTLSLQSSSAYEEDSIALARTLLGNLGFDKLPIDRKVSVHFLNKETKHKHTLSSQDECNGAGEKAGAAAREIERILSCADYFQVLELPLDKPLDAERITRAYRRTTLLVRAEDNEDAVATVVTRVVNEAYCCLMDPEKQADYRGSLPREEPLFGSNEGEKKQQQTQPRFKKNYGRHAFFSFLREGSGGDFRVMVKTRPASPESSEPIPEEDATEMLDIMKEAVSQRSPEGLLKFANGEKKHDVKVVRYKAVEVFYNEDHRVLLKKVQMEAVGGESPILSRWEICLVSLSLREELDGQIQTEAVAAHLGRLISLATQLSTGMGAIACLQEIQHSAEEDKKDQ